MVKIKHWIGGGGQGGFAEFGMSQLERKRHFIHFVRQKQYGAERNYGYFH